MASTTAPAETVTVSPGAVLEPVTSVPAEVFDALPAAAQAAVVARIVPERLRSLDRESAEAVLTVTQQAANVLGAMQDLVLAATVRCEELDLSYVDGGWSDGTEHRPSSVKLVASGVAPLLRLTPHAAEARVAGALCLVDELPRTRSMTLDGLLDGRQSRVIVDVAQLVQVGARALFDAAITSVPGIEELPPARLRRLCERTAALIDAGAMEQRAQRGSDERFVRLTPGSEPGMAWWTASLPSYLSMQAWAAVDALAHEYVRADPARSIDQARADAFLDLLLGSAQVSTTVEIVVPTFTDDADGAATGPQCRAEDERQGEPAPCEPAAEAAEAAEATEATEAGQRSEVVAPAPPRFTAWEQIGSELVQPSDPVPERSAAHLLVLEQQETSRREWDQLARGMLERYGLRLGRWRPPTVGVRDPRAGWLLSATLVAILSDPDVRVRLTRAEAQTGVTVARDPSVYRPNAALAQRVRDRDRTCRFPGCSVAARRCDLDHVVPFPQGHTDEDNLVSLCRTHHGFKHHAGWRLELDPTGLCTWRAPTGRSHVTHPADVREGAA